MSNLFAGIGTSHVPAIGAAVDHHKEDEAYWKPLFDGYGPVREWMAREKPDVVNTPTPTMFATTSAVALPRPSRRRVSSSATETSSNRQPASRAEL